MTPLDKGCPTPIRVADLQHRRWNVLRGDLAFPVAVLKKSALENNSRWMRSFIAAAGVSLAPHGKTTMAPQLFHQQIADGCWGITVATAQQAAVAAAHGIQRILIANQLVGAANIRIVLDLLHQNPLLDLYCYVDSTAGVAMLRDACRAQGCTQLNVLLEVGFAGGRTGCRDQASVRAVLQAVVDAKDCLRLRGIAGYEGLIQGKDMAETERDIAAFLDLLIAAVDLCRQQSVVVADAGDTDDFIVTAGGSSFFDIVAQRLAMKTPPGAVRIVIRSGCYLTHDHGIYANDFPALQHRLGADLAQRLGRLEPALHLWSMVQSQPEPGRALLTLGKRDAGHDAGLPQPVFHKPAGSGDLISLDANWRIDKMNDQHAYLRIPDGRSVQVGDLICLGISHPCTTFDKWRDIFVVDDDWTVVDVIHTFF
ncbi:MAG TPA: alanine racemase [Dongiaceae bacterium]